MVNILHVSANRYSGINYRDHTFKIWKELSKGSNKYYVFARSINNRFQKFEDGNLTLLLIPKLINPARIFVLSSFLMLFYIKKYKITHILCQSAIFGGCASLLAKKLFHIPVMIEIHGEEYFRIMNSNHFIKRFFAKILISIYKNATKVRSLNPFMSAKLRQHGINLNVVEIYNRVDLTLFNKVKVDFEIKGRLNIVSVGRFVKEKNYENFIKYLFNSDLDFHLTLIGGGPLKQQYSLLIDSFDGASRIKLIDWIDQKDFLEILIKSDIYIQPSISEGMPRTIVEAMALQMPIISTRIGSIEGVIQDEINGLLISPSENDIISAIKKIRDSETLRTKVALKAREDVINKYEWNKVFSKYRKEIITMSEINV